jgi:mono/diheme cytochrome c family protein
LWNVWEKEEKAEAEQADHDELMRLTFERYGWIKRPGDEVPNLPLGYTVDGKGSMGSNCFSCHGGKVAGKTILGAGNTHIDLTTLLTDLRKLAAFDRGRNYESIKDIEGPFKTPFNYNKGFTNAVIFPAMIAGTQNLEFGRILMANPEILLHHNMNPPPWWNFKKKDRIYADAFAPKTPRQLMPFARSLTASDKQFEALEPNFVHIYQYIEELEAPKYPFRVDQQLAERGKLLFEQTCSDCHGTYGENGHFPNLVVALDEVGTDPRRFNAVTKDQREASNASFLQYYGEHPLTIEAEGYLAQPLDGIWASAPYFHNGAAPTIWAVMNPTERPKIWKRSENGYDQIKVGMEVEEFDSIPKNLSARQRRMYYDTSHVGNSAAGHTFPDDLDADEKTAVIEYLKTL